MFAPFSKTRVVSPAQYLNAALPMVTGLPCPVILALNVILRILEQRENAPSSIVVTV